MSVKIRLTRQGGKKKPFYRVVVADSEAPRDGKFLEVVGTYNPGINPAKTEFKGDRVIHWVSKGAIMTDTVKQLVKKAGILKASPKAA
jgi:small subunit ribosomal protein S16